MYIVIVFLVKKITIKYPKGKPNEKETQAEKRTRWNAARNKPGELAEENNMQAIVFAVFPNKSRTSATWNNMVHW